MAKRLDITAYDTHFATRTSAEDWARIVTFRDSPRFMAGVRRHEGVMQPFFAHNLILNKVVTEVWRFQMLVFTLYLHDTRNPLDPRSGLTVTNLQKICTQLNLASPGRVYAFLNIMRVGGYLTSVRVPEDSRVTRLEPTARFIEIVEEWNDNIFAAIDAAAPEGDLLGQRQQHPQLGRMMRTSGAEGLLAGWLPLDPFPEVFHFAAADGGWLLMEHIALCSIRDGREMEMAIDGIALDLRAYAKQFGGSRSNLQRLLESGYELGLLEASPRSGTHVAFSPQMVCAFLGFMSSFLSFFQIHSRIALARIEAGAVEVNV
jgi:hypothetical protein